MLEYTIDDLKQTRVYQEVKADAKAEEAASLSLILRQLIHRFGDLPSYLATWNEKLSLPRLEILRLWRLILQN